MTTDLTPVQLAELRRKERQRGMADTDVVKAWYQAEDADDWELTPRQQAMRERWDWVKAQFLRRHRYQHVCDTLVQQFGVGVATARRDIKAAMDLFGEIDRVPKEAHRARAIEMALETFHVAKKNGEAGDMAKATSAYIAATGIDRDDPDQLDIQKLMQERTYVEALDPQLRELMLNFLEQAGGSIDVSKLFEKIYAAKNADYVPFESVPHDPGTYPG